MLTLLVHPDQLAEVPHGFRGIPWTDLPSFSAGAGEVCFLAEASQFPAALDLLGDSRVLNGAAWGVPRQQFLTGRRVATSGLPERYPVVVRVEHRGGCIQSPPLASENELRDLLAEWTIRSVVRPEMHLIEVEENPLAPFVSGSFLKLGTVLIPGRTLRFSDWTGGAETVETGLPEEAEEWAAKDIRQVAEITYLEQDGRARIWRIDDGLSPLLAYLAERPAARDALAALASNL